MFVCGERLTWSETDNATASTHETHNSLLAAMHFSLTMGQNLLAVWRYLKMEALGKSLDTDVASRANNAWRL